MKSGHSLGEFPNSPKELIAAVVVVIQAEWGLARDGAISKSEVDVGCKVASL